MTNQDKDNTVKIFSSTHPLGSEHPVPQSEKLVELLLPVIEECWQILEEHADNEQQFSAYMTIAMTLATQKFLQNKSTED
jgi:hypothetical protein